MTPKTKAKTARSKANEPTATATKTTTKFYLNCPQLKKCNKLRKREEKRSVDHFINFKLNCARPKLVYCQMNCNFQCPSDDELPTTFTMQKTPKTTTTTTANKTLLSQCAAHFLYTLPRLCLVVILLMSLLLLTAAPHASCQQMLHAASTIDTESAAINTQTSEGLNENLSEQLQRLQGFENLFERVQEGSSNKANTSAAVYNDIRIQDQSSVAGADSYNNKNNENSNQHDTVNKVNLNNATSQKNVQFMPLQSHNSHQYNNSVSSDYANSLIVLNSFIRKTPNNLKLNKLSDNYTKEISENQSISNNFMVTPATMVAAATSAAAGSAPRKTVSIEMREKSVYDDDWHENDNEHVEHVDHHDHQHDVDDEDADDNGVVSEHIDDDVHKLQRNRFTNYEDNQKLMRLVMEGLGLRKLPDMAKVNISQQEYASKYREYLQRMHERKRRELAELSFPPLDGELPHSSSLHLLSITPNVTETVQHLRRWKRDNRLDSSSKSGQRGKSAHARHNEKTNILLHFPLNFNAAQLRPGDIEEANIRLMLIHNPALAVKRNNNNNNKNNKNNSRHHCSQNRPTNSESSATTARQKHVLNLKVYQLLQQGKRQWIDGRKIDIEYDRSRTDDTHSQWLQFDVTKAVETWLTSRETNLGLEVQCDNCQRIGARILNDLSRIDSDDPESESVEEDQSHQLMPVLNIIGRLGVTHREFRARKHFASGETHLHHHHTTPADEKRGSHRSNCFKTNQRCCRHIMEVVFKEIKGFEFIIQPKVFDAGYCHGRCPPRYNPAHHHAMLQSLIWKQNRTAAPRPCCAPSKLVELEVLHVDEKDSEKLKISTWSDMRVVECACS